MFAITRIFQIRLLAAMAGMGLVATATANTGPIVFTERLNQTYGPELVSVTFSADDKQCAEDGVSLTGPCGPVATQLTEIEYWPGEPKSVKSAKLLFVIDGLKPLSALQYTVSFGKGKTPQPATDLQVKAEKDKVEITTAGIGVRMLIGSGKPASPAALKDIPSPLSGMRLGGANAWGGGSTLYGNGKIVSWTSELTDSGPVLARVLAKYTFEDGNVATISASVIAGDNAVRWETGVSSDSKDCGVELRFPPLPGVNEVIMPKGVFGWAKDRKADIKPGTEPFAFLSPNTRIVGIFPELPVTVKFQAHDGKGPELLLSSLDPAVWSEPVAPLTYAGFKIWELDSIPKMWDTWKRNCMPIIYGADGTVTLKAGFMKGRRKWLSASGTPLIGSVLDEIKNMVLEWPTDPKRPHIALFMDMQTIKDVWSWAAADPQLKKSLATPDNNFVSLLMTPTSERKKVDIDAVLKSLRDDLGLLGNSDLMRFGVHLSTRYDMLLESDIVPPADRALLRAQMAYVAYFLNDPRSWSVERGYLSGNPNMSCSYMMMMGVIACTISDHPSAKEWADYATRWMDKWLSDEVGTNGEWISEGSHYSYVGLEAMVVYAIAAKRAGFHDFSNDPRLKKFILYSAKYNTPRDPQFKGLRTIGNYGRGHGDIMSVFGVAAAFYKESDPELSRTMQWMWAENGYPVSMINRGLGGLEPYYEDRRLPAQAPVWGSELFPGIGALLRASFNTPNESYVNILATTNSLRNLDIWAPEIGGISQWFARGREVSKCFTCATGYYERHELLRNGVRLARNWGAPGDSKTPFGNYTTVKPEGFAALPQADYVRSTFTNIRVDNRDWMPEKLPAYPKVVPAKEQKLEWTRQMMFLKDTDPAGPAYLVLRDSTSGGQPTVWQFWTLSEKIGTPEQAKDPAAFLTDKPGKAILPARELPAGDRYTALGQFEMDVEYFIANPATTPRHTLRYGGDNGNNHKIPEYQDLLHLQQPGDGFYYAVVYPRPRGETAPTFSKLADGAILKIEGPAGTDYAFLSTSEASPSAEGISFKGTASAVQQRKDGTTLSLMAAGEAAWKECRLSGPGAAALKISADTMVLSLPVNSEGGKFTLAAPGDWNLKDAPSGVSLANDGAEGLRLTIPPNVSQIELLKRK